MIFEDDYTYITRRINNRFDDFVLIQRDITLNNPVSINRDNLVIDGNGCTIDAQGRTRIFNVTGNNVVLKNFIFTNANTIEKGLFTSFKGYGGAIRNEGRLILKDCFFINNEAENDGNDILNLGELGIVNCIFSQSGSNHSIFNEGSVIISEDQFELVRGGEVKSLNESSIEDIRDGECAAGGTPDYNFRYLDDLIHSGAKTIRLESDIHFDSNERLDYTNGINIDVDDLTIEGGGHKIDADRLARIFSITGRNVVIKDIVFENGFSYSRSKKEAGLAGRMDRGYGGAIYNQGHLELINCIFSNNRSSSYGGAIANMSDASLKINKCIFTNNHAFNGGAIFNKAVLKIESSIFYYNSGSKYGGAIINEKLLELYSCDFKFNRARRGGAINNVFSGARLNASKCRFLENTSDFVGAINNINGEIEINDSTFLKNSTNGDHRISGGAIYNQGIFNLNNCKFISNNKSSKTIRNIKSSVLNINKSSFSDSRQKEISSKGRLDIKDCEFDCGEDD